MPGPPFGRVLSRARPFFALTRPLFFFQPKYACFSEGAEELRHHLGVMFAGRGRMDARHLYAKLGVATKAEPIALFRE